MHKTCSIYDYIVVRFVKINQENLYTPYFKKYYKRKREMGSKEEEK